VDEPCHTSWINDVTMMNYVCLTAIGVICGCGLVKFVFDGLEADVIGT